MKKIIQGLTVIVIALQLQACGETEIPDPNPGGDTGFIININQNPYTALQQVGGSAIVTDKKVIAVRLSSSTWAALSSYCPSDASVNLSYNSSSQTFSCSKDNSTYNIEGKATSGSSTNLKKYNTTFSNNNGDLRIFE